MKQRRFVRRRDSLNVFQHAVLSHDGSSTGKLLSYIPREAPNASIADSRTGFQVSASPAEDGGASGKCRSNPKFILPNPPNCTTTLAAPARSSGSMPHCDDGCCRGSQAFRS